MPSPMRLKQYLFATTKETPAEAVIISHQLMLRSGMIRKLASGLYTWLPTGLRVLRKVEQVVREEMDRAGAQEVLMPCVQPAELWAESHRLETMGPMMLQLQDRHQRKFVFGPTHEEVVTDIARNNLASYKQLPVNFYQIQTKFRDEFRPRFGVMRAREFLMKDAYSFHLNAESLQQEYDNMYATYCRIFDRLGLDYRPVMADSGAMGGAASHEFQVLANSGEDYIAVSDQSDYAANIEQAEALMPLGARPAPIETLRCIATPNTHTIDDLVQQFSLPIEKTVKTLIVVANPELAPASLIALIVRGDHELNAVKAEKHPWVQAPFTLAAEADIRAHVGAGPGSLGPFELPLPIVIDRTVSLMSDFAAGANRDGEHWFGLNWERDCPVPEIMDLRSVQNGDSSPDGRGHLTIRKGIEVGHVFQLGTQYAEALNATVLNEQGRQQVLTMGCYGIGVSRIVAAAIEQNYDERGIIWSEVMAPFTVVIIPLNAHKSPAVMTTAEALYQQLKAEGFDVALDDRDHKTSPGVKFADAELLGIPHRLVISDRHLSEQEVEYKQRSAEASEQWPLGQVLTKLQALIQHI